MTASLTRRQLLQAAGVTLGALSLGRSADGQTPKDGGTFTSARTTEATGLDPQLVPAFSRSARSPLMYNQLVRFEPDMTPVPELAESWQVSSDSLQWTFKLRQGVKFHDGQELDLRRREVHVRSALREVAAGKSDFIAVDKVEPAGKYAVKFVTKEPFAGWSRRSAVSGVSSSARPASRSTATSTRPRSAPARSCWRTGRSSSRWSSRSTPATSRRGCRTSTR